MRRRARFGLQFTPAAGMLGVAAAYVLWSWRKLDAATLYLVDGFRRLSAHGHMAGLSGAALGNGDFVGRRIDALGQVAEQLRNLHRFVRDSLEGLPGATLVCDQAGTVLLANVAAARHFGVESGNQLQGFSASALTKDVLSCADHQPVVTAERFAGAAAAHAVTARDVAQRELLVEQAPSFSGDGEHLGWIVSLVDVTPMRQAQRQSDDAMRFLSHDMRAPLASILALLSLQRENSGAVPQQQFLDRIERHATKALGSPTISRS